MFDRLKKLFPRKESNTVIIPSPNKVANYEQGLAAMASGIRSHPMITPPKPTCYE